MTMSRIDVDSTKSMEEVADWLAMSASSLLDHMFPDQWDEAIILLAACRSWFAGNNRRRVAFPGTPAPDAERGFEFHA